MSDEFDRAHNQHMAILLSLPCAFIWFLGTFTLVWGLSSSILIGGGIAGTCFPFGWLGFYLGTHRVLGWK